MMIKEKRNFDDTLTTNSVQWLHTLVCVNYHNTHLEKKKKKLTEKKIFIGIFFHPNRKELKNHNDF